MKRVYVTGGGGFLGRSVVRGLAERENEVELVVSADLMLPEADDRIEGVVYHRRRAGVRS